MSKNSDVIGEVEQKVWEEQFSVAQRALAELQETFARSSREDWRASLAWEAVERAQDVLGQGLFNAIETPCRPPNFKHWKEKYVADPKDVL